MYPGIESCEDPEEGKEVENSACLAVTEPDPGSGSERYCGRIAGEGGIVRQIENGLSGIPRALTNNDVIDQERPRPEIRHVEYTYDQGGYSNGNGGVHKGLLELLSSAGVAMPYPEAKQDKSDGYGNDEVVGQKAHHVIEGRCFVHESRYP